MEPSVTRSNIDLPPNPKLKDVHSYVVFTYHYTVMTLCNTAARRRIAIWHCTIFCVLFMFRTELKFESIDSMYIPTGLISNNGHTQKADINFLTFFDSSQSNLYSTVRHRYNQLITVTTTGMSHLKLFTKHLKSVIDAQQISSDSCLQIVEQYRTEEPTLKAAVHKFTITSMDDIRYNE